MHCSGRVKGNYSYRFQAWCVLLPTVDGFQGGWVVAQSKNARSSVSSSSVTKSGTVCWPGRAGCSSCGSSGGRGEGGLARERLRNIDGITVGCFSGGGWLLPSVPLDARGGSTAALGSLLAAAAAAGGGGGGGAGGATAAVAAVADVAVMEVPPSVCVTVGGPSHAAACLSTSVQ